MLIFEIILTCIAWRRGWRWRALIPPACVFAIGFAIGASGGGDGDGALGAIVVVSIAELIVLGTMIAHPPLPKPAESEQPNVLELHYAGDRQDSYAEAAPAVRASH
jgi:hypothetical protein